MGERVAGCVSVIMPSFNSANYVGKAVASVMGQTHQSLELIVVDDGSADDSPRLLDALQYQHGSRMKVLHRPSNAGPFPARNLGLEQARGEWVAFLDADDWWEPHALARLMQALLESGADLAYCGWQNVGSVQRPPYVPREYAATDDIVRSFLRSCPWPIHAALVRRSLVDAVGGFSTRRFSAMDYDLWLRIMARSRRFVRVPEVLAYYRWHEGGQVSSVRWRQVLDAHHVRLDFIAAHPELVGPLGKDELQRCLAEPLRDAAYEAYWRRDLRTSSLLFRRLLASRFLQAQDLRYFALSQLPTSWQSALVGWRHRSR